MINQEKNSKRVLEIIVGVKLLIASTFTAGIYTLLEPLVQKFDKPL